MRLSGKRVWVMAKGFRPDEGGHQTYAEQIAQVYARLDARVTVFSQTSAGPRDVAIGPIRLVDLGADKSPLALLKWLKALEVARRKEGEPDFLHATTWRTSVPPMLLGLPFVTTVHGREVMYTQGVELMAMRRVVRSARFVIAVSRYSSERLEARIADLPRRPIVAWNGASLEPLPRRAPSSGPMILTLCRLEPRKNVLGALAGIDIARRRGLRFRYVVCGRGPEQTRIAYEVERRRLGDVVELAGFVTNERARELYSEADVFLHPQLSIDDGRDFEGFGIAIADAMLAGCAVIVGHEGGPTELVEHGVSGLIVDGRSPDSIADAIERLLTRAETRDELARAGRERVRRWMTWDRHAALVLEAVGL